LRAAIQTTALIIALVLTALPSMSFSAENDEFQPGAWTGQVFGHVMNDASGHADISYALTLGAGRFVLPGFSLNAEVSGWLVTQDCDDATGVGFAIVPRWHFYRAEFWSIYVDAGLGVIWTNEDVPPGAKKQNYTEFAGLGFTGSITESLRLMAGARYRHVSNANGSDNPGLDNIEGYLGLMLPF
jgi:hypothetical protein